MKIRSIRMVSFGKIRNRSFENIPDGLTVVVGNNETGKTTTMEFMRSTMFPGRSSAYPVPSKTDSGSMELETDAGEKLILQREHKKVTEIAGRPLPGDMLSIDQKTYRSVFAMDLADLTDSEAISSENIKNRFLTIPGGENVPDVLKELDSMKTEIMNSERITERNKVGSLNEDIGSLKMSIGRLEERMDEYDELAERRRGLKKELTALHQKQDEIEKEKTRRNMLEAQRGSLRKLAELDEERGRLDYSRTLSSDDVKRYGTATADAERLSREIEEYGEIKEDVSDEFLEELRSYENDLRSFIKGYDEMTDRREHLKDNIAEDEEFIEETGIPRELATDEAIREIEKAAKFKAPFIPIILLAAGIGLIALSSFIGKIAVLGGVALAGLGVLLLALALKKGGFKKWMATNGYEGISRDRVPSFLVKLERVNEASKRITISKEEIVSITDSLNETEQGLRELLNELEHEYEGMKEGFDFVSGYIKDIDDKRRRDSEILEMMDETDSLYDEIDTIHTKYDGKEGFMQICSDNRNLQDLDIRAKDLRENIEEATGMKVQDIIEELKMNWIAPDLGPEVESVNHSIGEVSTYMSSLISDGELGSLYEELNSKRAELTDAVREWGILALQESMVNVACTELYSKMQPSVIKTANRYLGMMTDERYSIDPDPRLNEVVIRDRLEHKTSRQWSSGLGDQVYLSLKMAVAKEMGSEHLPMILDDVLVRFDIGRRVGAITAILDFAKDQQAFLFSCDTSVAALFPDGTNIITLTSQAE
jgi:Uncharacterized conserved protein